MLREPLIFTVRREKSVKHRFDEFIEWARPFGTAGINDIHASGYRSDAPYFAWSNSLLGHGDLNARSWLLKHEYMHQGRKVFKRARGDSEPEMINPHGLISEGRFLHFAKAYLNVISHYRMVQSPPKSAVYALIFLEKALRDLNNGNNDPTNLKLRTFEKTIRGLTESIFSASKTYDISKEVEMLAGMLQTGFQSRRFRFEGKGFYLLDKSFAFSSGIPLGPRRRAIGQTTVGRTDRKNKRLSSEEVAAFGLAYRKAVALYGVKSPSAFMASIAGIPLTTTSMRMSELVVLRRDALYLSQDGTGRYRLRISRPKIGAHQDLPLPRRLGELAYELADCVKKYSAEAHEAFQFYVERFGDDFDAIDELFIPERFRTVFSKQYLTVSDINVIFGTTGDDIYLSVPPTARSLILRYVDSPGDISPLVGSNTNLSVCLATVADIERAFKKNKLKTSFPPDFDRRHYVTRTLAQRYTSHVHTRGKDALNKIFLQGKEFRRCIRASDLLNFLLQDFKSRRPPHWPYITKDRTTKVNDALLVWFEPLKHGTIASGEEKGTWWLPEPVSAGSISIWINRYGDEPPILFKKLDIRLKDGSYPTLTLHQTRKYHHTQALLAGANEVFIDELAGRKSGRQSDHYDLRTPHEILVQSIDTFDPDEDFKVIGPIAERARKIKVVERKAFLYENAAPKHVTEIGGCTTDWSINPCDQFGSCARCDKQVWRKGDRKRLPRIKDNRAHALEMIKVGEKKMKVGEPPHSLRRQLQQFKEDFARYNAILAVEADNSVEAGTLVTFKAPEGTCGVSDLTTKLRHETADEEFTSE
jgi:hypothetical protein